MGQAVPQKDRTEGIPDSDLHIYVTPDSCQDCGFLAWANSCVLRGDDNRPLFGRINYNLFGESEEKYKKPNEFKILVETALHELWHVLAMSGDKYSKFQNPKTGRNYDYYGKNAAVQTKYNRREKNFEYYLATPKVRELVREHFNCSNAIGARLGDDGNNSAGAHWDGRHAYNDFMAIGYVANDLQFTKYSFAVMEDSGWYKPDYTYIDQIEFGKNRGCDFITKCDPKKQKEYVFGEKQEKCNFYGTYVAQNNEVKKGKENICQFPSPTWRVCNSPDKDGKHWIKEDQSGEKYSETSRCFESDLYSNNDVRGNVSFNKKYLNDLRCLEFECDLNDQVYVLIRGEKYAFDRVTNEVNVKPKGKNTNLKGVVKGPEDWYGFCNTYPKYCKNMCGKNGYCLGYQCHCLNDYAGDDCSIYCPNGGYVHNGQCLNAQVCPSNTEFKPKTKECIGSVQSCSSGQVEYLGKCYDQCPSSTFQNSDGKCQACSAHCQECQDQHTCIVCQEGAVEYTRETYQQGSQVICLNECPQGFYSNQGICENCTKSFCTHCSAADTCDRCYEGYKVSSDGLGCEVDCGEGCDQCDIGGNCLSCQNGYFRLQSQNACFSSCPDGYYSDQNLNECFSCGSGCLSCHARDQCSVCGGKKYLLGGKCIDECPDGHKINRRNMTCEQCPEGQVVIFQQFCLNSCPSNAFIEGKSCFLCEKSCETCSSHNSCDTCPKGQEINEKTQLCEKIQPKCSKGCLECESESVCNRCEPGKAVLAIFQMKQCVDSCPPSTFKGSNSYCQMCNTSCKTCSQENVCDSCNVGEYLYKKNASQVSCVKNCPSGFEKDNLNKECKKQNNPQGGNTNKGNDNNNNGDKNDSSQGTGNAKCGPKRYEYVTPRGFSFCINRCPRGSDSNGRCK